MGGFAAVIYTDLIQAVILIAGSVVLTVIGVNEVGGFAGLREVLPAEFFHTVKPMSHQVYPWTGIHIALSIPALLIVAAMLAHFA